MGSDSMVTTDHDNVWDLSRVLVADVRERPPLGTLTSVLSQAVSRLGAERAALVVRDEVLSALSGPAHAGAVDLGRGARVVCRGPDVSVADGAPVGLSIRFGGRSLVVRVEGVGLVLSAARPMCPEAGDDTWGHPAVDAVLVEVSARLKETLRKTDAAARVGGEEIAVLLPETDAEGARGSAERLRRCVHRAPVVVDGASILVTASLGVAVAGPGFAGDVGALMREADRRLYQAKRGGRDRVVAGERVGESADDQGSGA
jgi:diguanylate cyclase (GGDEF)-like protein